MHRLLIVDDEEIIVNGLFEIFNGLTSLELDVYKAYSGEEAMDWLYRTRMDVVLSDIQMPGIDGMQLLEHIRKNWPHCRVVFLTGHSEFQYVYEAIQHPGVSYILKTEDHEQVIETVKKALTEIRREIRSEDLIRQAKEQMDIARELFQKDYLLQLLRGEECVRTDQLQFEQLGIPLHPQWPVLLLLGRLEGETSDVLYTDQVQRFSSVCIALQQYLGGQTRCVIAQEHLKQIVVLVQPRESLVAVDYPESRQSFYDKTLTFLQGTLETVQQVCRESLGVPVSFALSAEPCDWAMATEKYQSLDEVFHFRAEAEVEMLATDADVQHTGLQSEAEPLPQDVLQPLRALVRRGGLEAMERYLESGQREESMALLDSLQNALGAVKSQHSNLAIEAYSRVALCILSYINRWNLTEQLAFHIAQHQLMRFSEFGSWSEAVAYLRRLTLLLLDMRQAERRSHAEKNLLSLEAFIRAHLHEDLSLVRLAEQAFMNPSYLSRLYKQVMGRNLSEFIEAVRVQRAQALLWESDIRIHEVASQVGYDTAASFSRFFRKCTGVSPQEYREAAQSGKKLTTE